MLQPRSSVRFSLAPLLIGLSLVATPSHVHAGELYAVNWFSADVYTIDTGTGAATLVGTVNNQMLGGIAFDPAGVLHGVDVVYPEFKLYALDPLAGTSTLIADLVYDCGEGALTYDPNIGRFLSKIEGPTGTGTELQLIQIEPLTGAVTVIGNMGLGPDADIGGMTLLPNGTLLGYDSQMGLPDRLMEIDKLTGVASVIGPIGPTASSGVGGLAYDPDTDTVYMSDGLGLWTVDPLTGIGTLVGPHGTPFFVSGLAVLPTPQPCVVGLDYTSTLWDVDPLTGTGSNPRPLGGGKFGGLARSDTGQLFAVRHSPGPELHTVDEITGTSTLVGLLGIDMQEGGLDFDPLSGDLYGVNGSAVPGVDSELFLVDPLTGAATLVGPIVDEFGMRINASALAFDAAGALFVLKSESVPPEIYHVVPANGTVLDRVPIPGLGQFFDGGMDFDDSTGELFVSHENMLYRVDPYTGASLLMGPTPARSALEVGGTCAPFPNLISSTPAISLSTGTVVNFGLQAGACNQGLPYLLLGSVSGTSPGLPLDGLVLPLNFDGYMLLLLSGAAIPAQTSLLGVLDTTGSATASIGFPGGLSPGLVGLVLHHAALVFGTGGQASFVSQAVPLTLIP